MGGITGDNGAAAKNRIETAAAAALKEYKQVRPIGNLILRHLAIRAECIER
jgi:hypothetical protein